VPPYVRGSLWGGRVNTGEMFHNFLLHPAEQKYQGVNLSLELWKETEAINAVWTVLPMGFKPSPYLSSQLVQRAMEEAKEDPDKPGNPYGIGEVNLNLPSSESYDPTKPRVRKLMMDGETSGDCVTFCDDGKVVEHSKRHCQKGLKQVTS
jgi:hypothetical protein